MKHRTRSTVCLVDETFMKAFPDYKRLVKRIVTYLNIKLPEGFLIKYRLEKFSSEKIGLTWEDYQKEVVNKHKEEFKIILVDKGWFRIKPFAGAVTAENGIIISTIFPLKIPWMYKFFLKRVALHEMGHIFGLNDGIFANFSIMEYFSFLLFPRFTKAQKEKIKIYRNPKKKIGCFADTYELDFGWFLPKSMKERITFYFNHREDNNKNHI